MKKQFHLTGEGAGHLFPCFKPVQIEILAAVAVKNTVFLDVALCSPEDHRRFGGTYCLHLQDLRISLPSSHQDAVDILFDPEDERRIFL
jgi:hypothetical protein